MKKFLIWTALVLAAITACNKGIDTPAPIVDNGQEEVTPGKVTLTFTAAIGDETRTAYDDEQKPDQKARWVIGDKITVCVSNGDESNPDFKLFDFTATTQSDNNLIFSGEVVEGYTTIVSGIYPARTSEVQTNGEVTSNHSFSNGMVSQVYLPDSYSLGSSNDLGDAIPMVGKIENGAFTFHHICGALKITIVDIFNTLTFTTAAETITGDFPLTNGRIEMPTEGASSTVTFTYDRLSDNPSVGERFNRTFYIPIPDGTLTSGAKMALKSSNKVVYEKTTPVDIQYNPNNNNSNVIKRLSAIELHTPEGWYNYITEAASGSKGKYTFHVTSGTDYVILFTTKSNFKSTYHESVAEFIETKALGNTKYSNSRTFTMNNNMNSYYGKEYIVLNCAVKTVDGNRHITFDYYLLDYQFPTEDYLKWIGKWTVDDETNADTWTITRKETNQTYSVSGLFGMSSLQVEASCQEDGSLLIKAQKNIGNTTYTPEGSTTSYQVTLNLYGRKTKTGTTTSGTYDLMKAVTDDSNASAAALAPAGSTYFFYNLYGSYVNDNNESKGLSYGTRSATATMTRVTE